MSNIPSDESLPRELDRRTQGNIEVSLLWMKEQNRVSVRVVDPKGRMLELPLEDESPLHVFHHPYAYAAFRGIAYECPDSVEPEAA